MSFAGTPICTGTRIAALRKASRPSGFEREVHISRRILRQSVPSLRDGPSFGLDTWLCLCGGIRRPVQNTSRSAWHTTEWCRAGEFDPIPVKLATLAVRRHCALCLENCVFPQCAALEIAHRTLSRPHARRRRRRLLPLDGWVRRLGSMGVARTRGLVEYRDMSISTPPRIINTECRRSSSP